MVPVYTTLMLTVLCFQVTEHLSLFKFHHGVVPNVALLCLVRCSSLSYPHRDSNSGLVLYNIRVSW